MLCGLAALDITPKLGENIPGYFEARHASGVREPLAVRALACSNTSGAAFALVNLDTHATRAFPPGPERALSGSPAFPARK